MTPTAERTAPSEWGPDGARERRLAEIVGAVAAQTLHDWGARRIALLDDGSPEAELAGRWLRERLGDDAVVPIRVDPPSLEPLLQLSGTSAAPDEAAAELRRMKARMLPDALVACAANKTTLLLGGPLPPDPLLPLGDLYASEIAAIAGDCSIPAPLQRLAERCGGIERLDDALRGYLDGRDAGGLRTLGSENEREVLEALGRGRGSRFWPRIVPKIGRRTIGLDLFE